jgi:hypothetical protein
MEGGVNEGTILDNPDQAKTSIEIHGAFMGLHIGFAVLIAIFMANLVFRGGDGLILCFDSFSVVVNTVIAGFRLGKMIDGR